MNSRISILIITIAFLPFHSSYGQNFEWLRSFGTKNVEQAISIASENSGNSVAMVSFGEKVDTGMGIDTLRFDSILFPIIKKNNSDNRKSFLLRMNNNGKVIGSISIGNIDGVSLCKDDIDNYYIIGTTIDSFYMFNNNSFDIKNGAVILIKLDSLFNVKWLKQVSSAQGKSVKITYSNKHLYFICNSKDTSNFDSSKFFLTKNSYSVIYGEINCLNGKILWAKNLFNNIQNYDFKLNHIINHKKQIFISGKLSSNNYLVLIDSFKNGGFLIKADSNGNYKSRYQIPSKNNIYGIEELAEDGENLYLCGVFSDSLLWNGKWIYSSYKSSVSNIFVAAVSDSFKQKWFYSPTILNPNSIAGSGVLKNLFFSNGFLYASGNLTDKIYYDNQIYHNDKSYFSSYTSALICKFDAIGNLLWMKEGLSTNSGVASVSGSKEKGVFISGTYRGELNFDKFKDTSNWFDAFITKLSDNAIIRGQVKAGPYCAGDTLRIP